MTVKLFHTTASYFKNQCYLIHQDQQAILVDPSWNYDLLNQYLIDHQLILQGVLLTHSHDDHTDLAATFAQHYGVPVFMSQQEITHYKFTCPNLSPVEHLAHFDLGKISIMPILTPGHTAGSTCYLIGQQLFSGDTVFIEGVGVCLGNGSDVDQLYDSIQFLKQYLKEDTIIWPGHSYGAAPGKPLSFLLKNNIYFNFQERSHFVTFRMRKKQPDIFGFE